MLNLLRKIRYYCNIYVWMVAAILISGCSKVHNKEEYFNSNVFLGLVDECNIKLSLPLTKENLVKDLKLSRMDYYESTPNDEYYSGDNIFPPRSGYKDYDSAIVLICKTKKKSIFYSTSPRYAFYVDKAGQVTHIERHELNTSL